MDGWMVCPSLPTHLPQGLPHSSATPPPQLICPGARKAPDTQAGRVKVLPSIFHLETKKRGQYISSAKPKMAFTRAVSNPLYHLGRKLVCGDRDEVETQRTAVEQEAAARIRSTSVPDSWVSGPGCMLSFPQLLIQSHPWLLFFA